MSEGEAISTRYVVEWNDKLLSSSANKQGAGNGRHKVILWEKSLGMQSANNGFELTVFDEPIAGTFGKGIDPISKRFDPLPAPRGLSRTQQARPVAHK